MKKLLVLVAGLIFVVAFAGCDKQNESDTNDKLSETQETTITATSDSKEPKPEIGMKNPMTEYSSLKEMNDIIGSCLQPLKSKEVSNEKFFIIDYSDTKMAEYTFDLDGLEFTFRASADYDKDISGIYLSDKSSGTAFEGKMPGELEYAEDDSIKVARWATADCQYVVSARNINDTDSGEKKIDEDLFKNVVEELKASAVRK